MNAFVTMIGNLLARFKVVAPICKDLSIYSINIYKLKVEKEQPGLVCELCLQR